MSHMIKFFFQEFGTYMVEQIQLTKCTYLLFHVHETIDIINTINVVSLFLTLNSYQHLR